MQAALAHDANSATISASAHQAVGSAAAAYISVPRYIGAHVVQMASIVSTLPSRSWNVSVSAIRWVRPTALKQRADATLMSCDGVQSPRLRFERHRAIAMPLGSHYDVTSWGAQGNGSERPTTWKLNGHAQRVPPGVGAERRGRDFSLIAGCIPSHDLAVSGAVAGYDRSTTSCSGAAAAQWARAREGSRGTSLTIRCEPGSTMTISSSVEKYS
jgi:hypothetical protein